MFLYKRNSSVATLLLIIHVTMHNYQKSSLAHQVRIIQIFIKAKLYQIGKSVFLFFSIIYKIILIYKITFKNITFVTSCCYNKRTNYCNLFTQVYEMEQ